MGLVQKIPQVLMNCEDTYCRICFSMQVDGTTLDNSLELKTIETLKDNTVIKVVEEACTIWEAFMYAM